MQVLIQIRLELFLIILRTSKRRIEWILTGLLRNKLLLMELLVLIEMRLELSLILLRITLLVFIKI